VNGDPVAGLDRQLMRGVSAGSAEALGALYDRYGTRAHRIVLAVCRDDGRAQEAVQDAFMSIWRSAASYSPARGTVAAWLLTLVRHRAVDVARRNGRHAGRRASQDQLSVLPSSGDMLRTVIARDDAETLLASLALLPDAQQEVITLAFYGELSHTEIAAHIGLAPGTVKGRMRLGLHKLRADIDQAVA
jgi:RNA polymerase sigma-70 factor (ECF subfamily)